MSLFGRLNNATLENVYVNVTKRHQFGSEDQLGYVVLAESLTNSSLTNVIVKAESYWGDRSLFTIDIDAETIFENVYVLSDSKFNASFDRTGRKEISFDVYTERGITKLAYEATGADAFPDTYWDKTGAVGFKKKDAA